MIPAMLSPPSSGSAGAIVCESRAATMSACVTVAWITTRAESYLSFTIFEYVIVWNLLLA